MTSTFAYLMMFLLFATFTMAQITVESPVNPGGLEQIRIVGIVPVQDCGTFYVNKYKLKDVQTSTGEIRKNKYGHVVAKEVETIKKGTKCTTENDIVMPKRFDNYARVKGREKEYYYEQRIVYNDWKLVETNTGKAYQVEAFYEKDPTKFSLIDAKTGFQAELPAFECNTFGARLTNDEWRVQQDGQPAPIQLRPQAAKQIFENDYYYDEEDETNQQSLDLPFIDLFLMGEGILFMVMCGSAFCCLCLVIGGLIGRGIRIYTDKEVKEDKVYDTDIV